MAGESRQRQNFTNPAFPTPMSIVANTADLVTVNGTLVERDAPTRSDEWVELTTCSHVVQYVSSIDTMPRLQLATRMVREQAVHSGHGRSLTREGNTLDRTITVAAGGTSARGGMFVLPVSPSGSRYANFLSVADVLREEDGSPQLADWKQMYDNVFYV